MNWPCSGIRVLEYFLNPASVLRKSASQSCKVRVRINVKSFIWECAVTIDSQNRAPTTMNNMESETIGVDLFELFGIRLLYQIAKYATGGDRKLYSAAFRGLR